MHDVRTHLDAGDPDALDVVPGCLGCVARPDGPDLRPLARFIVFAGADYEASGGAKDQLLLHGGPGFQHVADAADAAEKALEPAPGRHYPDCEWAHVAEVTPEGLQIIAMWEV